THTGIPYTARTHSATPDAQDSIETPLPIIPPGQNVTSAMSAIPADLPYATPTSPASPQATIPAAQIFHKENLPGSRPPRPRTVRADCIDPAVRPPRGPRQIPRQRPPPGTQTSSRAPPAP